MWKKPETPVPIDPRQVVVGLYVWIDLPWDDHPFLYSRFQVTNEKQASAIRRLPILGKIHYFPDKSTAAPRPVPDPAAGNVAATEAEAEAEAMSAAATDEDPQQQKRELLCAQKDAAARADRAWEQAARVTREAMLAVQRTPRQAGEKLLALSDDTARKVSQGQGIMLHLLGDKEGEGPQFHALNVMTLAVLVGKAFGLGEPELADLALGALTHDVGKGRVPAHILKAKTRLRHEEQFYREHSAYGVEMAKLTGVFRPGALSIVGGHHEFLDGSGWPTGQRDIGLLPRIVAVINRYDRLCSPESPEREPLTPAEALVRIFKHEAAKFDPRCLSVTIKLLGIYPPGTIVRLSDESLALVVCPGKDSLRPVVVVYAPEIDKRDAPTIDLCLTDGVKIEEVIRPSSLPQDVLDWIQPRQRLSYFFSTEEPS